jgi:single-strand DNA-binding protein
MAGLNRVMLIGNVGRDAEVRYTQGGQTVANFSLATTDVSIDRQTGERKDYTEWHNIVVWGRQAEIAGQYVKKGRQLYVEGRLKTRDWVDPQGIKHFRTEVYAQRFQLLGRRDDVAREDYESTVAGAGTGAGRTAASAPYDEYDIGDLGPPLDMDDNPLSSPGD